MTRACGELIIGGSYLVTAPGRLLPCYKLPQEITECPCCGEGIRFYRGFKWQKMNRWAGDCVKCGIRNERPDYCQREHGCPFEEPRAGVMWVGSHFYTPGSFAAEAEEQGISKRLNSVPRDFKPGESWVILAHPQLIYREEWVPRKLSHKIKPGEKVVYEADRMLCLERVAHPGMFLGFQPLGVMKVVTQAMLDEMDPKVRAAEEAKGVIFKVVEDTPEHRGTVWDEPEEEVAPPETEEEED